MTKVLVNHTGIQGTVKKTGPMDGKNHAVKVIGGKAT